MPIHRAGTKRHFWTASIALSSHARPIDMPTLMLHGPPCSSTTIRRTTGPCCVLAGDPVGNDGAVLATTVGAESLPTLAADAAFVFPGWPKSNSIIELAGTGCPPFVAGENRQACCASLTAWSIPKPGLFISMMLFGVPASSIPILARMAPRQWTAQAACVYFGTT